MFRLSQSKNTIATSLQLGKISDCLVAGQNYFGVGDQLLEVAVVTKLCATASISGRLF